MEDKKEVGEYLRCRMRVLINKLGEIDTTDKIDTESREKIKNRINEITEAIIHFRVADYVYK